jgi:nucleotide-binding universal stress UspA family protein
LIAAADFRPVDQALIAWDGGRSAGEAIHFLTSHPLLANVSCTLLHASTGANSHPGAEDAAHHLASSDMEVTVEYAKGPAVEVILRASEEHRADLVVMGAFGHSRIRSLIIGSTTTEVLMTCPVSMLVFH